MVCVSGRLPVLHEVAARGAPQSSRPLRGEPEQASRGARQDCLL